MTKRLVFTFEDKAHQDLKVLASEEGVSLAEMVRRSLSLTMVLKRQKALGFDTIILENSTGNRKEVILNI